MLKAPHETIMVTKRGPIVWNKVISCFISLLFIMFLYIRQMTTKASSSGSSGQVRGVGGAEKHKIYAAAFGMSSLLWLIFTGRGGGGGWHDLLPPRIRYWLVMCKTKFYVVFLWYIKELTEFRSSNASHMDNVGLTSLRTISAAINVSSNVLLIPLV